jgi:hypothetical protein
MFVCRKHKETVKEKINDKQTINTINNNNNNNNNHNKQFNIVFMAMAMAMAMARRVFFVF